MDVFKTVKYFISKSCLFHIRKLPWMKTNGLRVSYLMGKFKTNYMIDVVFVIRPLLLNRIITDYTVRLSDVPLHINLIKIINQPSSAYWLLVEMGLLCK